MEIIAVPVVLSTGTPTATDDAGGTFNVPVNPQSPECIKIFGVCKFYFICVSI